MAKDILNKFKILLVLIVLCFSTHNAISEIHYDSLKWNLNINNISSLFRNTGVFDAGPLTNTNPGGFEWPKGSGKSAIFSAGLTIAGYLNNQLRMAAASYQGEYAPGYIININGIPVTRVDSRFRFYKVTRGDNQYNNPDWLTWGNMVPFGAPFTDVNHNGIYDTAIDTPGVKGADQTIFICLTDGFPETHTSGEGFGGGTLPIFSEVHLTAWAYNKPGLEDMQFIKWDIINKSLQTWSNAYFAVDCYPSLGNSHDDYIGCDTIRQLGYCYNADNLDSIYGYNPPAVGFLWLNCNQSNNDLHLKSFTYLIQDNTLPCENLFVFTVDAYTLLKGVKKDGTPWVIPNTNPPRTTKFCYSGDPETGNGWTEYGGQIKNCGNVLTGEYVHPTVPGDRFFIMSAGNGFNVPANDTNTVIIAQLIARGTNNKNSVTKLKQLSDAARNLCSNGFVIGVNNISSEIPDSYMLYQNYPNPFNPVTKIKFDISMDSRLRGNDNVTLKIYDILGREVATLINEKLTPGTYEVVWEAVNNASGVYFYKLETEDYSETKKMVLMR